jgi:hypothetical protein
MKAKKQFTLIALFAASLALCAASSAFAQASRFDELANLPFVEGRPTKETVQTLRNELLFQRATQTYLWAMPLINTLGMQVGSEKVFGAGYNVLPIWKKRLDAKTLVTTPNSDVLYAMSYVDLGKDGPLVMEAPPERKASYSITGSAPSRSMVASSLATSAWLDRMAVRAESFCCCRLATRERCRKVISSTVQPQITSLSSCAGSMRTRRI